MRTNHYESVVILNAALEEDVLEAAVNRTLDAIKTNGSEIITIEKWGRKRLAYAIQKSKSGYYLVVRYSAPTDSIKKIERFFYLEEAIIRYMTVSLDAEALAYYEEKAKKAEQEKEAANSKPTIEKPVVKEEVKETDKSESD